MANAMRFTTTNWRELETQDRQRRRPRAGDRAAPVFEDRW
jgi:hypothetical protein